MALKILHFSDVHVEDGQAQVSGGPYASKRLAGWLNLALRRRGTFADAAPKLAALAAFMREQQVDVSLCTGDYTALGTHPELRHARAQIEPLTQAPKGFVTVPGNHDVYLPDAIEDDRFNQYFGEFIKTTLPGLACDGPWPQVHMPSPEVAIVAVDSARPNPSLLKSSGAIPQAQLDALAAILDHPRVRDRFIIVATHYAPRLANGQPDRPHHGLDNAEAFVGVCARIKRGLIAHGHVHWPYIVRIPELHVPLCCAGSATHRGREAIWIYELDADHARATPGEWQGDRYALIPQNTVSL